MNYLAFVYKWNSRELKKIIIAILKSGLSDNIKRFNYVQGYSIKKNSVEKNEERILLVKSDNQSKLEDFLSKNFPQKVEKIYLI